MKNRHVSKLIKVKEAIGSSKVTKAAEPSKPVSKVKTIKSEKAARKAKTPAPAGLSGSMRLLKAIFIASGLLVFLVTVASLFFVNFNTGVVLLVCIAGFLIIYGALFEKLVKYRWLTCTILAGCVLALSLMVGIGVYGIRDTATYQEDAVIVLGAGIRGERVSLTLARRLVKAAEYAEKNPEAIIVVSGARGLQEDITEALAMERFLIDRGVSAERIIREEEATSTYENLLYSKAILDRLIEEPYKVVVITNEFHIFRASKLAEKLELNAAHIHSKTEWYEAPRNYLRECLALFKFWFLGK